MNQIYTLRSIHRSFQYNKNTTYLYCPLTNIPWTYTTFYNIEWMTHIYIFPLFLSYIFVLPPLPHCAKVATTRNIYDLNKVKIKWRPFSDWKLLHSLPRQCCLVFDTLYKKNSGGRASNLLVVWGSNSYSSTVLWAISGRVVWWLETTEFILNNTYL